MSATVTVATQSSLPSSIASADFVGDGTDDQIAVNAAINSLPDGGLVQLCEGTYTIRANNDGFRGGIVINKSNIQLQGRGPSTRLMLANNQDCNVIRVWGDDIENVVIRDLYIHGNRATNATSNFETCGIRASSVTPPTNPQQNIVVDSCIIEECYSLNVQLWGSGVFVRHCWLGDSTSDSGELLGGPGAFTDNYVEISGTSGFGIGTDQANDIRISSNTIKVTSTGRVTQAIFRTWGGRYRNVIDGNQVFVEPGGYVRQYFETSGYMNVISNNCITGHAPVPSAGISRGLVKVNTGTLVSGNMFQNVDFSGFSTTSGWPLSVVNNYFFNSAIIAKPVNTMLLGNVFYP